MFWKLIFSGIKRKVAPVVILIAGLVGDPLEVHVGEVAGSEPGVGDTQGLLRRVDDTVDGLKRGPRGNVHPKLVSTIVNDMPSIAVQYRLRLNERPV